MEKEIRIAIAGIGNCASNLIQGLEFYSANREELVGLRERNAGGYDVSDIKVVAAFDVASNKVGKDLSDAIFEYPNCTQKIYNVKKMGIIVQKGPTLDGWGEHFQDFYSISSEEDVDVEAVLKEKNVDVLVIMIPTGSHNACYQYIKSALNAGVSVVNGIPVLASHDEEIVELAKRNKVAIVGDDFKSQIGGTILHHTLLNLLQNRGVDIAKSYQLNYAGNMDFLNLVTPRGNEKHKSKKRGVTAGINDIDDVSINVSYLENQDDNKTCQIYIEGYNFGRCKVTLESKLTVVDSANSSGVVIDAIRCLMVAKRKKIYGRLEAASAYFMKSPYKQIPDEEALELVQEFLSEK